MNIPTSRQEMLDRLVREHTTLANDIQRLSGAVGGTPFNEMSENEQQAAIAQLEPMRAYRKILEQRIGLAYLRD